MADGLVQALGLSSFSSQQIDDLLSVASVRPAVQKVECHPYLAQNKLIAHCQAHGLKVTASSPLDSSGRAWHDPNEPFCLRNQWSWHCLKVWLVCSPDLTQVAGPAESDLHPQECHTFPTIQNIHIFNFTIIENSLKSS